ncbi:MAG: methyltransferase [Clostridia bacterium]|nr:methyltransferase [Clostridia bacterium]
MIRLDDLQIGGLKIYQDSDSFCFGTDAVFLSWFASVKKFTNIVDLCSGNGIVAILLSRFGCMKSGVCIELNDAQALLCKKSIELNLIEDKLSVINTDLRLIRKNKILPSACCDLVTVNPPYSAVNSGTVSQGTKSFARAELECTLKDVAEQSAYLLRQGGRLCVVHRPERLSDLICECKNFGLELKRLKFVCAHVEDKPSMILAEFIKYAKSGVTVEPPLIIYDENNQYTDIVNQIYERGNANE